MATPALDIRAILASGFGEDVILVDGGGGTVHALPTLATAEDLVDGDSVVIGRTRCLRFASADVPTLVPGHRVTWSGTTWRVTATKFAAMGHVLAAFLGTV